MTTKPNTEPARGCPNCWRGKTIPCAVNCREMDECCDKPLGTPCHCEAGRALDARGVPA